MAGPGKKTRPQTKNSPAVTPRRKPVRKIELEAAPRPLEPSKQLEPYPIVGVGASAGGFEAFRELLKALPSDTGLALVLVQHLDPGHESLLAKLLSNATPMSVREVEEGMAVRPNHVYVIPPNKIMGIRNGTLHLIARGDPAAKHLPVDYFLTSLAEDRGNRAVGVILSGTASDGTMGLKAIKAEGGITFAQDSKSAKYDGMPRSAIAAGCVDLVLTPDAIARELARIGQHSYLRTQPTAPAAETTMEGDDDLRRLFLVLQKATGADFRYYKYSTIKRRIARRMLLHKLESLQQYLQFLRENPAEPAALCEDILIHVTGFFREPEAFEALAREIFPKVFDNKAPGESIRVWVPGCSAGEETYSVAMVLLECLGDRVNSVPIQIFGTDISEVAVDKARAGVYSESSLAEVSPERLRRFFVKVDGGFQIAKSLREMCVFARQDLAQDPPFSRLDLVSCRNVLIYMGPVLHKKVMGIFHYALRPTGFLMLGKSESISGFTDLFTVVDREHKIWSKRPAELSRRFGPPSPGGYDKAVGAVTMKAETQPRFDVQKEADRFVLSQCAPPGLIVNENLQILNFRGDSSPYLSPSPGEASLGLLRMVRPEFAVELRTALHHAKKQEAAVRKEGIRVQRDGHPWDVCLEVVPIKGDLDERFFLVLFHETPAREPAGPQPSVRELGKRQLLEDARLRMELQTIKANLQSNFEVGVPIVAYAQLHGGAQALARSGVEAIGRLAPGISVDRAQAEFDILSRRIRAAYPDLGRRRILVEPYSATSFGPWQSAQARMFMALLTGVALLTLLVVCANVANLMLGRSAARRRELAVRQSLGASRARILSMLLSEGLLLSVAAAAAAWGFAWWVARAIPALIPPLPSGARIEPDLAPDWRVAAYALALAIFGALVFTLAPSLRAWRQDLLPFLKAGERGVIQGRSRLANTLVVLQLAFCVLLLGGAALASRSVFLINTTDLGFPKDHRLILRVNTLGSAGDRDAMLETLRQRLGAIPNVSAVSYATAVPPDPFGEFAGVSGETPFRGMVAGPRYLEAVGVRVVGRDFRESDAGRDAAILTRSMAEKLFAGRPAPGRTVEIFHRPYEVIGVVPNAAYSGLPQQGGDQFLFVSRTPGAAAGIEYFNIRYGGPLAAVAAPIRGVVRDLSASRRIVGTLDTMDTYLQQYTAPALIIASLLSLFSAGSLIVAGIGLYAAIAFHTARRTREFGIRLALGATSGDVLRTVFREGLLLTAIGSAAGLALSAAAGRLLGGLLFGVSPIDPLTWAGVILLLAGVAMAACYMPARRAGRIQPVEALRQE